MAQSYTKASLANWNKIKNSARFDASLNEDDRIGAGHFGQVFRYKDSDGNLFALKRIRLQGKLDDYDTPPTDIEDIELLLKLRHSNIVKFSGVKRSTKEIYLFMELVDGQNLHTLVQTYNRKNETLPHQTANVYAKQILRGLQYLHARRIVHRDVKPGNILLNAAGTAVKLTDFGLSKQISTTYGESQLAKGTFHYMAPEVVRCERFSVKSDIWSVGATLVEMLTGYPPYGNVKNIATVSALIYQLGITRLKPEYDRNLSNDTQDLLDKILQPFPAERPSASALLALEYFSFANLDGSNSDSDDDTEYCLSNDYKGRTLIINNVDYVNQEKRFGSDVDANRLKNSLEAIGFKVDPMRNLTADAMILAIEAFVAEKENKKCSSFIVTILAHGFDKGIGGVDGKVILLKDILNVLSSTSAPMLTCKPKVLLIQACRNSNNELSSESARNSRSLKNRTVTNNYNDSAAQNMQHFLPVQEFFDSDTAPNRQTSTTLSSDYSGVTELDKDSAVLDFEMSKSDILVAYSTCRGHVAYRDRDNGSFFIQSICDAVDKYWRKMSLLDMLSIVTGQVGSAVFSNTGGTLTQIPQVKSTLRQRFFLSLATERSVTAKRRTSAVQASRSEQQISSGTAGNKNNAAFSSNSNPAREETAKTRLLDRRRKQLPNTLARALSSSQQISSGRTDENAVSKTSGANLAPPMQNRLLSSQSVAAQTNTDTSPVSQQKQILVLAGGYENDGAMAYDTSSDTWATVASMSWQRWDTAATLWQGKVVVAGGWIWSNYFGGYKKAVAIVEQFDPETNSWTVLPGMEHKRKGLALACLDNTLFAIGGGFEDNYHKEWCNNAMLDGDIYLSSVERFDSNINRWQLAAPLKVERGWLCCAVLRDKILAVGGYDGSNRLESCEMLDGATQTWHFAASLQTARWNASASTVDEKVYVFGGYSKDGKDSVEEYAAGKWTLLPVRLSVARSGLAAATVDGRVYICGGDPGSIVVECFDASTRQISRVAPLPKGFDGAAAASVAMSDQAWSRLFGLASD